MIIIDWLLILNNSLFVLVPCKHQLVCFLDLFVTVGLDLLYPIGVSKGIEGRLRGEDTRGDVSYHYCVAVPNEGLLQDHSELTASEGKVLLGGVQRSDALL